MSSTATTLRPYVLSIAGFDPSGGAGLVADAKAFEAQGVYGLTVATAITVQHESVFRKVEWLDKELIKEQVKLLLEQYPIHYCKIGLIEHWEVLQELVDLLRASNPSIYIVVDPIFRASAGFDFGHATSLEDLMAWLPRIDLLTPNAQELAKINPSQKDLSVTAQQLAKRTTVLYKGGHNVEQKGVDVLFYSGKQWVLPPPFLSAHEKHGSGCVLSASIVGQLAKGLPIWEACQVAKNYTTQFLTSNPSLLGYHYNNK